MIATEIVSPVFGEASGIATRSRTGAVFCTVAAAEVSGAPASEPSSGVTVTVIASFLSPLPGWERSRLAPVAPAMSLPFLCHW